MFLIIDSPSPVPPLRVVKKGSKILGNLSSGIPHPLSTTLTLTYFDIFIRSGYHNLYIAAFRAVMGSVFEKVKKHLLQPLTVPDNNTFTRSGSAKDIVCPLLDGEFFQRSIDCQTYFRERFLSEVGRLYGFSQVKQVLH